MLNIQNNTTDYNCINQSSLVHDKPFVVGFFIMTDSYIENAKQRLFNGSMPEPNTGCIFWMGDSVTGGYGRIGFNKGKLLTHRLSYMLYVGEIPNGFEVDHLCKQPGCINPAHLEAVTPRVNFDRSNNPFKINSLKTHCNRGHEFTHENTFIYKTNPRRDCRTCMKERSLRSYYKTKNIINHASNQQSITRRRIYNAGSGQAI